MAEPVVRTIEAVTHGRFLVSVPASGPAPGARGSHPLLVGFHGYGENAERHLEQLRRIPGTAAWLVVSVQGLHRFYASRTEEVVASWMTRQDREQAIADNVAYVDRVVGAIAHEHAIGRLVFAGFSQGVAMAFRATVRGAWRAHAVIALGGDIPPDVRELPACRFSPALIGRGTRDTWYTDDKLKADVGLLESKGVHVDTIAFEGGHEWTDQFREAAARFLSSLADSKWGLERRSGHGELR